MDKSHRQKQQLTQPSPKGYPTPRIGFFTGRPMRSREPQISTHNKSKDTNPQSQRLQTQKTPANPVNRLEEGFDGMNNRPTARTLKIQTFRNHNSANRQTQRTF